MFSHSLPSRSSFLTSKNGSSAPSYTAKPLADEITLESSSICGSSSGDFEHASGSLALRLHGQIDGVSSPIIYHKHPIGGAVLIQSQECSGTTKVSLKMTLALRTAEIQRLTSKHLQFEGILTMEIDTGVNQKIPLLAETHVLWEAHDSSTSPPALLPLHVELTPDFAGKDGQRRPLPPTCRLSLPAPSSIHVCVSYSMTLTLDRRRTHGVLPRSKS